MTLSDYLAKNYLNADKPTKAKKRKRKGTSGLIIADDDAPGWPTTPGGDDEDDGAPTTVVAGRSAEFRKAKTNAWKTVGAAAPSNSDQAAADAILAAASAEDAARRAAEEEGPEVMDEDNVARMESGARAGLQTADQVAADLRRKKAEERRDFEDAMRERPGAENETIYRDASGRIVNVQMKRAELRKKAEDEAREKAEEEEAARGDVQRLEKDKRRQDLADAKYLTIARGADDEARNAELKQEDRWNDPAAQFLTKKKKGKSSTGKPLYKGAAPPNRYGIRPGHRWDGVDRGTGFEREYFAAQNRRRNMKDLEYAWQMDE